MNHPDFKPLSCLDCHFTSSMQHTSYKDTPADTFNNKCKSCHNEHYRNQCTEKMGIRNIHNDNCVHCHMPSTGVFDIPHVVISDHFIRVSDKWQRPVQSTKDINTGSFIRIKSMTSDNPDNLSMARGYLYQYEKFHSTPAMLDSALFYLRKLPVQDYPSTWVYYYFLKRDYQSIVGIAEKFKPGRKADAIFFYQIGQSYHHLKFSDMALDYFGRAVTIEPYNLDYRNKLGTEYLSRGDYQNAKREFEFIIRENPKIAMAHNNLGFIFLLGKEFNAAEKSLHTALRLDPDYLNAHLNLLKLYFGKGQVTQAKDYLNMLKRKFGNISQLNEFDALIRQYGL